MAFWPNLKEICILLPSPTTPDGDWYFIGDPNIASYAEFSGACAVEQVNDHSDSSDSDSDAEDNDNTFRSIPNPAKMNPLLLAMARAVQHAPSLQHIWLDFSMRCCPKYLGTHVHVRRLFEIHYFARGVVNWRRVSMVDNNTLLCKVADWRLDEEVEKQWRDVLGQDGTIEYLEWEKRDYTYVE